MKPCDHYDGLQRLIGAVESPGTSYAYDYDALSRMTGRGSTTYTYNGDGTLVKQIAGGGTTRGNQSPR